MTNLMEIGLIVRNYVESGKTLGEEGRALVHRTRPVTNLALFACGIA